MFGRVDVPVLGLDREHELLRVRPNAASGPTSSRTAARAEAARLRVALLGELALDSRSASPPTPLPIVISEPDSLHAGIYKTIAASVWSGLTGKSANPPAPKIVIE